MHKVTYYYNDCLSSPTAYIVTMTRDYIHPNNTIDACCQPAI